MRMDVHYAGHLCSHTVVSIILMSSNDLKETQPNLALHSVIQELSVYCTHRANGCDAILTLETLDHHVLVDCKHKLSPCPNASLGCRYIGIPATLNEHHCVFDQMRVYIDAVNDRMTAMEDKIIRQNKELERLREFVRTSKTNPMLPMTTSVSPPASAEVVDENDEQSLPISTTWSLGPLECIKTIKSHTAGVTSLAHSPGFIYSGSHKGVINVHDEHLDQSTVQVSAHKSTIWSLAHDAHSDIIYSASSDKTIKVHSLVGEQPSLMATLTEHTGKIYSLLLNSTHLFSCSSDKTIKIWDSEHCVTSGGSLNTLIGHSGSVNGLACSNNGVLISASSDLHVKTWDVSTGQNLSTYFGDGSEVLDVSQSNTTGLIYASTYDASILCFDPRSSAEPVGTLVGHNWEGRLSF